MNRWLVLSALVSAVVLVVGAADCNPPTCGPGTKEHQKTNGDIECLPADGNPAVITCDADAGATIVAGKCVSTITCGANTKLVNGVCVGTGGGGGNHTPDPCPPPDASHICVNGVVRHLLDNSYLGAGEKVHVTVYEPLSFLKNPANARKFAEADSTDTYTFPDMPVSPDGLIAVAVGDPAGTTTQVLQLTGSGAIVQGGQSYQVDSYATPASLVQAWSQAAGIDYNAMGAYVAKYFKDAAEPPTALTATETMPVSGVQIVQNGKVPATAKYFGSSLMMIDTSLTATSAIGGAILPGTGATNPPTATGMGGGITWESQPGDSTAGVVFVQRFHPCVMNASGMCM